MTQFPIKISLDGDWEFAYVPDAVSGAIPIVPAPDDFQALMPTPGYWDDHLERIRTTALWNRTRFNPNYRRISFPVGVNPPDASLPYLLGVGWYRKRFNISDAGATGCITLHVGGVVMEAWVWLNGGYIAHHIGHSTPFELPLDGLAQPGANELIIAVANTRSDRLGCSVRGYNERSGGIYRSVYLALAGPVRIRSLYLRTDDDERRVVWRLELAGRDGATPDMHGMAAQWIIGDRVSGRTIETSVVSLDEAGQEWITAARDMRSWSDRDPALYKVVVRLLRDGARIDERVQDFGFRRLRTNGFDLRLNGHPIYLRGACEHHYYPLTCTAPMDVATYRANIRRLKAIGFNWLRFHTWIPSEEYMQAADEMGMLIQVEAPYGAVTDEEWLDIFYACRHHPSVIIYCGGNEELLDEAKIELLEHKAALMRKHVPDALFNPMEALRGVEYGWAGERGDPRGEMGADAVTEPYLHNPRRLERLKTFCDVFGQYAWGHFSYSSVYCNVELVSNRIAPYQRPCLSHELCITANYINLDLERRYEGSRIGTGLFAAVRRHLADKGLLAKAATYYHNSCAMMRIIRKHAVESVRKVNRIAGYDLLGATDHHWPRTGYPCGIMNEFHELKLGESERDVLRYNGESVLLLYIGNNRNFTAGDLFQADIAISLFGPAAVENGDLSWTVSDDLGDAIRHGRFACADVPTGKVTKLGGITFNMPDAPAPRMLTLNARLAGGACSVENAWNFWVFPLPSPSATRAAADATVGGRWLTLLSGLKPIPDARDRRLRIVSALDRECAQFLQKGGDVLLLGHAPFPALTLTFQSMPTGRPNGHRGLVVGDHPALSGFPHEGFGDWQFYSMLEGGCAVVFDDDRIPFDPIVEVIPCYKHIRRQAALFESRVGQGRLMVCSLRLEPGDPAAVYLMETILAYITGSGFTPRAETTANALETFLPASRAAEGTGLSDQAWDPNAARAGNT